MSYAHELAILLFEIFEVDDREGFEKTSKTDFQSLRTFSDSADDSMQPCKKNDNSISFCEVMAFEDKTFAFVYRHPLGNKIQHPGYQKTDANELQEAFSGVHQTVS